MFQDEAGIRSDFHSGTTSAPKGQTPVVTSTGARFGLFRTLPSLDHSLDSALADLREGGVGESASIGHVNGYSSVARAATILFLFGRNSTPNNLEESDTPC